jgi:inhibitor of KinA
MYRVDAGFRPVSPILPDSIRASQPAQATPRTRVPAGSVAIGGELTGVYPLDLPGGWHLIGRSPLRFFDPAAERPSLLVAGDRVRFVAVTPDEYADLEQGATWR